MGSQLQQALGRLCSNTGWDYAVFWKVRHGVRIALTWEDAYYINRDSENKRFSDVMRNYSHDSIELALAKMSYYVYSFGEGIIGQVAVTGKHLWISADTHVTDSSSSSQYCDGWRTQFSAGIKTVAVVAVIPHGVVQLGSCNKIAEDVKLVNHVRDIFFELQDCLMTHIPIITPCSLENSCLSDVSTTMKERTSIQTHMFPSFENSSFPRRKGQMINRNERPECSHDSNITKINSHNVTLPSDNPTVDISYFPRDLIDSAVCGPEPSNLQIPKIIENNHTDALKEFFRFAAGCELYEALGPAFQMQNTHSDWETENTETVIEVQVGLLNSKSESENLLEAVVANVCSSDSDAKSAKSLCKPNVLLGPIGSTGSIFDRTSVLEEERPHCLSSCGTFGIGSSKGFSPASTSWCSEELEGQKEASKNHKKRARPSENCRPRPRDRQLIQDRIKELRELVPNGSKCSIDSLLERAIKHMLFMQCITKYADKLDKCAESKFLGKETSVRGSSIYEQGSCWAMEVGPHMKVCPIKVETINMNGQMLVEMLSADCSIFLEIAEVIRSLGLTILKGVTETQSDKTLISFVIEGQNNRSVPRMDILWSLMQLLQSKINT